MKDLLKKGRLKIYIQKCTYIRLDAFTRIKIQFPDPCKLFIFNTKASMSPVVASLKNILKTPYHLSLGRVILSSQHSTKSYVPYIKHFKKHYLKGKVYRILTYQSINSIQNNLYCNVSFT